MERTAYVYSSYGSEAVDLGVQFEPRRKNPRRMFGGGRGGGSAADGGMQHTMQVPTSCLGLIIGKVWQQQLKRVVG